ncbi:MAG: hypothetical protein BMS9Abin02_1662 [Anaerolineae bacterium]|nr:MAG: hypothetical protein BMS9Abin02_1662 [Anaerolineae bacterium]
MTFGLFCMGLIALLFGLAVVFSGYRLFLVLLPIWGFFVGFFLGVQTIQWILSEALLATVTSWVVGFIVGAIFAILSYLFYFIAVGIISFSLGYGATFAVLEWIGMDFGFLLWLIAVVIGIVVALAVYYFNIQKYAIIVATAVGGAGLIIYTLLALGGMGPIELMVDPVKTALDESFWWLLFFIVVAGLGIIGQIRVNRDFEAEAYDHFSTL